MLFTRLGFSTQTDAPERVNPDQKKFFPHVVPTCGLVTRTAARAAGCWYNAARRR